MPTPEPQVIRYEPPARLWRRAEPRPAYDVVIVGAGGHGLATAFYLAERHGITHATFQVEPDDHRGCDDVSW